VFERFTERARQVVVLAQDEARLLKHNYIGTEHLLLGLLREEEGLAARVLSELDVKVDDVRARVRTTVGEGQDVQTGQIPFTPRAKQALELSLREALGMGHNYIGTEHVLLGLTRHEGGVAAEILRGLGTDADSIHSAVISALGGRPSPEVRIGSGAMPVGRIWPPQEDIPQRRASARPIGLLVTGWLLFALALGVGILIGWAIWHH
jgi:ATP-dependent Clp protease ATP-binding subunit ClpC